MLDLLALLALGGLAIALLVLIALPIILAAALVVALLKLVFFVILLPFRILGLAFGIGIKAIGLVLKGALLFGAVALVFLVGLLPLAPLLLLGVVLYLLLRPSRARSAPAGTV
jgi:hypothetical protein